MNKERENYYKDYRLQLIMPILNTEKSKRAALYRQISEAKNISIITLKRYVNSYENFKLDGLVPKYKGSGTHIRHYVDFDVAMERAIELRKEDPHISVKNIIMILESEHPDWKNIFKRATMQRYLQKYHVTLSDLVKKEKNKGRKVYGRYRKAHRLEQVQCDVKVFPDVCVNEKNVRCRAYLQLFSDNYSRKILSYTLSDNQTADIALSALRTMVEKYGKIDSILTDNGSIYRGAQMLRACTVLGIDLKFCKPYEPTGKGMIERQNLELNQIEHQIESCEDVSLEFLGKTVGLWIDEYNNKPNSELGNKCPNELFENDTRKLAHIDQEVIHHAFTTLSSRKVEKDGSISVNGKKYKVDMLLLNNHARVTILIDLEGQVWHVADDNTAFPMAPMEVKPDVDEDVFKKETELEVVKPKVPSWIAAVHREAARRNNTYKDEESFMKELEASFYGQTQEQDADASKTEGNGSKSAQNNGKTKTKKVKKEQKTTTASSAKRTASTIKSVDVNDSPFAHMNKE